MHSGTGSFSCRQSSAAACPAAGRHPARSNGGPDVCVSPPSKLDGKLSSPQRSVLSPCMLVACKCSLRRKACSSSRGMVLALRCPTEAPLGLRVIWPTSNGTRLILWVLGAWAGPLPSGQSTGQGWIACGCTEHQPVQPGGLGVLADPQICQRRPSSPPAPAVWQWGQHPTPASRSCRSPGPKTCSPTGGVLAGRLGSSGGPSGLLAAQVAGRGALHGRAREHLGLCGAA